MVSLVIRAVDAIGLFDTSQFLWLSTPAPPAFTEGQAAVYDLTSHIIESGAGLAISLAVDSAALPTGVTLDTVNKQLVYDGLGADTVVSGVRLALDVVSQDSEDADYLLRKAQVEASSGVAQNYSFASRSALMTYLEALPRPAGGIRFPYTGVESADPDRYQDPIPVGTREKIGIDTSTFLTGSTSVLIRMYDDEVADGGLYEAGPVVEFPFPFTSAVNYECMVFRLDQETINHNHGTGDGTKILFNDHLNFTAGQIVTQLAQGKPWISPYRVTGTSTGFRSNFASSPYGSGTLVRYTALDNGGSSATQSEFDVRFGPSSNRNDDPADPDFVDIPRVVGDAWNCLMVMTDQSYMGSISRGIYKAWLSHKDPLTGLWTAPVLIICAFRDAQLPAYPTKAAESQRAVFRPEDSTIPHNDRLWVDQMLWSPDPFNMPGGYALPYPGQEIPPWLPVAGTTEV